MGSEAENNTAEHHPLASPQENTFLAAAIPPGDDSPIPRRVIERMMPAVVDTALEGPDF